MRRVRYYNHGGPEVLAVEDTPVPEPGPGQVLIRAEAIGLSYVDTQIRAETDSSSIFYRPLPGSLTGDAVGTVERVSYGVDPALTGTRVAALVAEDACAEFVLADADWLVSVPAGLSAAAASVLPTMGPVALGALRLAQVTKGDTVMVTAAAGGVGHLAIQLARHLGARTVIAAVGSRDKAEFAATLGADVTVNYSQEGWADQVRTAAPAGADVILEALGGNTLLQCVDLLAPFGRVVGYGAAGGDWGSVPLLRLAPALKSLSAFSLLALRAAAPDQARANTAELTRLLESGDLRATTTTLPMADIVEAHRLFGNRAVLGRLLVEP
jgi:NADPH:quinone reductase-like Zn-dependent oxidoreductase